MTPTAAHSRHASRTPSRPSDSPSLRALLIDDHDVSRAACRALLRTEGVAVVADLPAKEAAPVLVHQLRPDVAIVDICPYDQRGLQLARCLRALGCSPTVVLTFSAARDLFGRELDAFPLVAKGDLCAAELHHAIHAVEGSTPGGTLNASTAPHETPTAMTCEQIDALMDAHYSAEVAGDLQAIVAGFTPDAEHDVAGRPGGTIRGCDGIAAFYHGLLSELRIERFEQVRRRYGPDHATDESILHAIAVGQPFGVAGHGRRLAVRILHVFDFRQGLIGRESAWLDLASLYEELAG